MVKIVNLQGWDASRISAAIPSGVGFLGAGMMWKQIDQETNVQRSRGLTTAASSWLSAGMFEKHL